MMNRNIISRFQQSRSSMVIKTQPVWTILWPFIFTLALLAGFLGLVAYARPVSAQEQKGVELFPEDDLVAVGEANPANPTSPGQAKPASATESQSFMDNVLVYSNDFEGTVGAEWSTTSVSTTPIGARRFLGRFSNNTASLTLNGLAAHEGILVTFDLFIIQSWDGNSGNGPDIWELNADGSSTLIHTTFGNFANQAYPDSYPGGNNPAYTGTTEIGTLGYTWSSAPADAVYQISKIFTHTVPTLTLNFLGSNLQGLSDESWGIDNVFVYIIPVSGSLTSQFAVTGAITQTVAGDLFNLDVTALDGVGDTDLSYTGTVAFTSSDPQATLPITYTFTVTTDGDNGRHTFPGLALKTAGLQTITAFDVADPSVQGTFTTTVLHGPPDAGASQLSVTAGPYLANGLDEATITVTVVDIYGNPIPNADVWIEASGLGGALSPAHGVANASGVFSTTLVSTVAEAEVIRALVGDGQTMVWLPVSSIVEFTRSAITGRVFSDMDGDGSWQSGEPGLGGVQVTLYSGASAEPLKTTVSHNDGGYTFTGLISGTYRLEQVRLDQFAFSDGGVITVTIGDFVVSTDNDFGNYAAAQVDGEVWNDGNQDGQNQEEEPPIPDVTINALDSDSQLVDSATTDVDGLYHIDLAANLPAAPDNFVFNSGRFELQEPATAVIGNNAFDRGLTPLDPATYPDNYDFSSGDLGSWTVSNPANGIVVDDAYSIDGPYLQLTGYEQSAYSPAFTVYPNAQSLRFDFYVWTTRDSATARPLYVYALTGEDFSVTTSLGSVSGSNLQGWRQAVLDLQAFQGQTIKLRFRTDTDSYWNSRARVDNISLNTELPDWTFNNAVYTAVISDSFNLDGPYLQLVTYDQSAYSPAFVVPENAQSLRFDYYLWTTRDSATSRPLYIYALTGEDFSVTTSLGSVSGSELSGWRQAVLDLQAFQGQTIKLRFRTDTDSYWNSRARIDNISLYVETPNWDPTSVFYVAIGEDTPPPPTSGATAPENADFAQEPGPLDPATYPENNDFDLGRTPLPTSSYPSNYDFSSGVLDSWVVSDPTYGDVISDVYNLDGYHLRLDRYEVSAYSPVFTVPNEVQSLRFDYYNYTTRDSATARPLYIYALSGPDLGTTTQIGSVSGSKLQGWLSAVIDLQAYRGQTIQLRFRSDTDSYWNTRSRIDNLSLEVEVPNWEITSSTYVHVIDDSRSLPGSGNQLLLNRYDISAYSGPLTIPTDAQSLRFDYYNYTTRDSATSRPLYVYVLSGPTFGITTQIGSASGSDLEGWKSVVMDIQAFQGQTVKFRFRSDTDSYWNTRSRIDNIGFYTDLPQWTPTSAYYVNVKSDNPPVNPPTNFSNGDFSSGPIILPAATYPDNYDFSHTRVTLDPATYPSNYNFETGDLGDWTVSDETYGSVISDSYNLSGPYLYLNRYEVSAYSPVFTVPVETQSLHFNYYNWSTRDTTTARPLYIYVYSGPDLGTITQIGSVSGSESLGWQEAVLDLQAFQGQAIQLRFRTDTDSYWNTRSRIDNLSLHTELPDGWTPTEVSYNYIRIVSDTYNLDGPYLYLNRYELSAYSPSFTVPATAQSLHFNYYNWSTRDTTTARPLYVYVYSGPDLGTVTQIGAVSGSESQGWQTARLDLQQFQGQTIRLRFRTDTDSYWNTRSRIDNISLNVEVPSWTVTDANLATIQSTNSISGPYLLLNRYEVSAYTPAFLVPTTTTTLNFNYYNSTTRDPAVARPLYVYAYGGDNFSVLTSLGSVSGSQNSGWQSASIDVSALRGRYIKLRFRTDTDSYWNGRSQIDNIALADGGGGGTLPGNEFHDDGDYVHLSRYDISIYSTAFFVPTNTQDLTFDYLNWTTRDSGTSRPLYVYALSGPDFSYTTQLGSVSGSHWNGWRQGNLNLSGFRGQVIKLRFRTDTDSYWNGQSKIDNIALTLDVGGGGGSPPPDTEGDGTYIYLSRYDISIYSAAFDVPTNTQSLRFDYLNWTTRDTATSRPLYVYVLSGPDFSTTTSLGSVSGSALQGWKQGLFNLTAFQGQTIKLRFRTDTDSYWNGQSKIDNVYLLPLSTETYTIEEINPVNYTSTTSDVITVTAYGGAIFNIDFGDFAVDRYQSTVEVTPTQVVADGVATAVVTVTLRDGSGNPLSGYDVEINAPGINVFVTQPLSPTNAAGQAVGYISSTYAQEVQVTARSVNDNVTLAQAIALTFAAGPTDPDNSTLIAEPTNVVANGLDESTFTVTLLDAYNNPVPGKTVAVIADSSFITLTMNLTQTNALGQISGTVRSNVAQTVTLQAEDVTDFIPVYQTAEILFTSASPELSTVAVSPTIVVADGVSGAVITVTLRDQNGSPLPGKPIELLVYGEGSYINGVPADSPVTIGYSGPDGVVTATLTSDTPGYKTILAYGDGILLDEQPEALFTVGPVDPDASYIEVDLYTISANGAAFATITTTLYDSYNHVVPDKTVVIQATGTNLNISQSPYPTDDLGQAVATISSTDVQFVTITAVDQTDGITLTQTVEVEFVPGPADASQTTAVITPTALLADNVQTSTITITVRDVQGHLVADRPVQLVVSGSNNTITPASQGSTDYDGTIVFYLASLTPEVKQISLRDLPNDVLIPIGSVEFIVGEVDTFYSLVTTDKTDVIADGVDAATVTVYLYDAQIHPIPGKEVTLLIPGSNITITQPISITNSQGWVQATVSSTDVQTVTVTAVDATDNITLTSTVDLSFRPGPVDLATSNIVFTPTTLSANGIDVVTITGTLYDGQGRLLVNRPVQLLVTGTGNVISPSATAVADASGQVTFYLSSATVETKTLSLRDLYYNIDLPFGQVAFIASPADVNTSELTADKLTIGADNTDYATLTATIRDSYGHPLPDKVVNILTVGSNLTLTQALTATNAAGQVQATIRSSEVQTVTVTAVDVTDGFTLTQVLTLTFAPAPANAANSTIVVTPTTVLANNLPQVTITATLQDALGRPLSNRPIQLQVTGSNNTITPDIEQTADASGTVVFQLGSSKAETKQISIVDVAGGAILPAGSVVFEPVTVDVDNSYVSVQGSSTAAANGQQAIAILVTARDMFGNAVPNATVVLTSTGQVDFVQPPLTNASGQALGYVTSDVVGTAEIRAIVDDVLINDTALVAFEGPDLAVNVSAPSQVTAGYPMTYTISIANEGYLTATNVIVTDTLPNHTTFITQTSPYSYTYNPATREIVWQVGVLTAGTNTLSFVAVNVSPGAPINSALTNQLEGRLDEPELDTTNNQDTVGTLVKAPVPELTVMPLYPTLVVPTGLSNTLVVTVTNTGTAPIIGLSAAPPIHIPWTTISQTTFGDLMPGQWVTFTVTADASGVSTNGHYRDRLRVNTTNSGFADIFMDIHVRPPLRDLRFDLTNNLGNIVPGAAIALAEPIFVVTEGVSATQTYYRQATTTATGKVTFYSLETDKTYSYNITAANHDPASGSVGMVVGGSPQIVPVVLTGRAGLNVTPGSVAFAMYRGELDQQTLVIRNTGAADMTDITLSSSGIPFLFLGQPPVGTIVPPGGFVEVTVNAAPLLTDTIDVYNGNILVTAAGGQSTSLPVQVKLLDVLSRDLCIEVRTDLGNPLTNAEVRLTDLMGQVVSSGGVTETLQQVYVENTGTTGYVCYEDLHPGPYHADVGRGEIRLGQKSIEVEPGEGVQEEVIIVSEPSVTATWSVTPTTIEDVYTTVLTLTFIPYAVPQLAFSPDRINLCGDTDGVVTQTITLHNFYPITLTNTVLNMEYNGNITASVRDPQTGASTSGGSMFIGTLTPNEHRDMELTAAVDVAACMGDQGLISINVEAEYEHFVPESWYHVDPTNNPAPPGQESRIPLKLANTGFPTQSNLNSIPPTLENITLIPPQLLTWMDVSTTTIGSLPVGEEVGFDLVVNPPQYLAQGLYYDYIQVTADNGITAMIGIEAEMTSTGLHIETQFVTPLTAGEGGPGSGTTPPIQAGQPPEDWDDIVTFWNPDIFGPQDAIVGSWNILVGCYCSSGGGGWTVVGNSLIHVQGGGGPGPGFAYAPDFKDNVVILELSQRYSLDREAFIAQLNLSNALPESITDVEVSIIFMNGVGNEIPTREPGTVISPTGNFTPVLPSNSLVPTSTIMQGTPGSWQKIYPVNFITIPETPTTLEDIPSGESQFVSWTLVPDAPGLTEQAYFTVQAIIRYKVNGEEKTLITSASTISVSPQPRIVLDYFIPNYVLGGETFDWLVVATNVGYGTARNFRVETPQPKIIKQSELYPTDFTLIGPSVLNWGDVPPGEQVSGVWRILPSNPGSFVDWKAACKHQNYMGVELPELIYCTPRVHFLDTSHLAANQQRNKGDSCFGGLFQAFSGDPVNTFSGNFTFSDGDVTIPGWGAGLQFERTYNSDETDDGPLGPGWTHSYNMGLTYESIISRDKETNQISQITYFAASLPHGSIAYFAVSPDGNTITPFPGVKAELTRDFVTYTLVQECNQMVYTYNAAQQLTAMEDPNGNRTELTYDVNGNLTTVTDESGRTLTFTYDSNDHITSMTDPLGRVAVYTYTLGYLSSVRDFRGEVTNYTYTLPGDKPGKLRSVIDANGNTEVFNHYDENGRVDWQEDALGNRMTYAYNFNNATEERSTTTADALGYASTDQYSNEGLLVRRVDNFNSVETYAYDENNNLIRMTDKNGHVTLYEWDECGCELLRVVDAMGDTSTMTYNAQHQIATIEDERGYVTTYAYDATGVNPTAITDPLGYSKTYTYGPHGEKLSETDENGHTTYFAYDQYGSTTTITNALGYVTQMEYDIASRMIATTDALGRTTTYVYDLGDNLLSSVNPLSGTTSFAYDGVGNMTGMTDPLGQTTTYEHDPRNLLIRTTDALGNTQETEYDAVGNVIAQTDGNGHTTTIAYEGFDVIITNPLSGSMQYTNDPVGNRLQVIDFNGNVTQYVYDANDRVIQTIFPDGSVMSSVYDQSDHLLRLIDGEGRTVIYTYDETGRVETKTDPEGGVTTYTYDGVDNQIAMEDAEGRVTTYAYDALNRLVAVTNSLGDVTTFTYDAVGNQTGITDANGNIASMVFDTLNRPILVTDPLSGATQYEYDAVGNPLRVTNPLGQVTTTQYDALNRPVTVTNPLSGTMVYEYDQIGNVLAVTDEEGNTTQYTYDALNRTVIVANPLNGTTAFTYDPNGNMLSRTDAEGRVMTYAYDVFNQVVTTTNPLGGVMVYEYDHVGNILQATDPNNHTIQYAYDGLDRVITATDSLSGTTQFTYDAVSNLLELTDPEGNSTTTTYDDLNRPEMVSNALNNTGTYEYDPVGNLISMTDAEGRVTQYIYDDLNRLVQLIDPLGNVTTYAYDALGNQISLGDALGRETTFEYDDLNRLIRMTNAISGTTVYTYSPAGNLIAERNSNGQVTTYDYDALYRPIQITDSLGQISLFTYDAVGNLLASTDPLSRTTNFAYDDLNRLVQIANPAGGVRLMTYDPVGNQLSETDENGRTVGYAYDALNRLVTVTDPLSQVTTFAYDAVGNQLSMTDPLSRTTNFTYDAIYRLTTLTDAAGQQTTYTYDQVDNLLTMTDAAGRTTTYDYDDLNRPILTTNALSSTMQFVYDAVGNQIAVTDAAGRTMTYAYDDLDRLEILTDPLSQVTQYEYDPLGNLINMTDALGRVSTYQYDTLNRLTTATNALGGQTLFTYDAVGNLTTQVDPLGAATQYTFDSLDRLLTISDALNQTTTYTYDPVGNILQLEDANGAISQMVYDALNRLTSHTNPLGQTTTYEYDAVGNQTSVTDPLSFQTDFTYDVLDRLVTITDPLNRVTTYEYDPVGNQTGMTDAEGVVTRYEYDDLDRLTGVTENFVSGGPTNPTTNVNSVYAYDPVGNMTEMTNPLGNTFSFTYDALNRLSSASDPLGYSAAYNYDAVGNLVGMVDPNSAATSFSYDALNRLTTITRPDELVNFTYDAVGNRLSMSDLTGLTQYSYDAVYRLTSVTDPLSKTLQYVYDAVGNRTGLVYPDGDDATYDYDEANRLTTVTDWDNGETQYIYDDNGRLIQVVLPNNITGTFGYDAASQLTLLQYNGITGTVGSYVYSYDQVGNRIEAIETVVMPDLVPTAIFAASPRTGAAPLNVTFYNNSVNADTFTWDFGDGEVVTTTSTLSLTHTYSQTGYYTVTLTAENENFSHTLQRVNYILVVPPDVFQEIDGQVVMEAEHFHADLPRGNQDWLTRTLVSGYEGESYMQALPDRNRVYASDYITSSPELQFQVNFVTAGTYNVWVYGAPINARSDSVHVGLNGQANPDSEAITGFTPRQWGWSSQTDAGTPAALNIPTPGLYTINVWMREDGFRFDRIILTTDGGFVPTGGGPAESPRAGDVTTLLFGSTESVTNSWFTVKQDGIAGATAVQNRANKGLLAANILSNPGLMLLGPLGLVMPFAFKRRKRRRREIQVLTAVLIVLGLAGLGWALAYGAGFNDSMGGNLPYIPLPSNELNPLVTDANSQGNHEALLNLAQNSVRTITYAYDPLYRLSGASYSTGESFSYAYDAAGNRVSAGVNGGPSTSYTYDVANRLIQVGGQNYSYDNNGNLLDDGQYTYAYDTANRLTQLDDGISTIEYTYNGDGVRVGQTVDGLHTDYVQDIARPIPQVLTASQGGTVSKYLYGLGLIGEHRGGTGPSAPPAVWQYTLADALGSIRQVTDESGSVILGQHFDPFGGLMASGGSGTSAFGFAGEEQDPLTGLIYLRARTYNPETGRFLQQDSVFGDPSQPRTLHRYSYAFNSPVSYTDPTGHMPGYSSGYVGRSGGGYASAFSGGGAYGFMGSARMLSANAAGDPPANGGESENRPFLCQLADFAGDVVDTAAQVVNWALENPDLAIGIAIIAAAVILTGGAAIPAILVGAAIGAAIGYGAEVIQNFSEGQDIFHAFYYENIDWNNVARAGFEGAVSGAVAGVLEPVFEIAGATGLVKVGLTALGEFVSGRVSQIALNVMHGDAWDKDLWNLGDIALDVIPGVAATSFKSAWKGAKNFLRGADDVAEAVDDVRLSQLDDAMPGANQLDNGPSASQLNDGPSASSYADDVNAGGVCAINSFTAGTLVATATGMVAIEDVQVGDYVLAADPETGEQGNFEVVAIAEHPTDQLFAITIEAEDENATTTDDENQEELTQDVMQVTPEHPVYVEDEGWILAENLEVGDRLRRVDGGWAKVLSIEQLELDEPATVYNFTVKGVHTYFVLDAGVLVHNKRFCPRVGGRSDYDSWIKGQLTDEEWNYLRARAGDLDKPIVLSGSLSETDLGLSRRYDPDMQQHLPEYRQNKPYSGLIDEGTGDIDFWRGPRGGEKFTQADVDFVTGHPDFPESLSGFEVDPPTKGYNARRYPRLETFGGDMGGGALVFEPDGSVWRVPSAWQQPNFPGGLPEVDLNVYKSISLNEADFNNWWGSSCSFSFDTLVSTEDGSIPIGELNVGDEVLAYNKDIGEVGYYPIIATWSHEDPLIVHLTVNGELIETTPEHPFYKVEGGWVPAVSLKAGDHILQADWGTGVVDEIQLLAQTQIMYNFTVDVAHTYFVGDGQWLVHNACFKTTLGGKVGDNMQAHHVIPNQLQNHPFVRRANRGGWNHDAAYNGILLPDNAALGRSRAVPYHVGSHANYTTNVENMLNSLERQAIRNGWTPQQAHHQLFNYARRLKYDIYQMPRGTRIN